MIFLGTNLKCLSAEALDLQTYYAMDFENEAIEELSPENLVLFELIQAAWKTADNLSPVASFLKEMKQAEPAKWPDMLKQTDIGVQEQALREVLIEWLVYHQHDWPDLSEQAAALAQALATASHVTAQEYLRFQQFLAEPELFALSSQGFEKLLWHTHQAIFAYHFLSSKDLKYHTAQMQYLAEKLSLPTAYVESRLLQVLHDLDVLFVVKHVAPVSFSRVSTWMDPELDNLFKKTLPFHEILLEHNRTFLGNEQIAAKPESMQNLKWNLETLRLAQATSSDFLVVRCFLILEYVPYMQEPSNIEALSPYFLHDYFHAHPSFSDSHYSLFESPPPQFCSGQHRLCKYQLTFGLHLMSKAKKNDLDFASHDYLTHSLRYYEAHASSLYPLLIHWVLSQELLHNMDPYHLQLPHAEKHLQQALHWAKRLHKQDFQTEIDLQLIRLEKMRQQPETQR